MPTPQSSSPPLNTASTASCQLLDFFGENLAYIDESSDTLSDRGPEERGIAEPREALGQLSLEWGPPGEGPSDMQPPSNPSRLSLSDLPIRADRLNILHPDDCNPHNTIP
ncbi:potassium channel subfamily K member 4 [Lates japonicus]|uniref:Potassium channel subfamily K member 4 n=1 Tax=Lates japonicus TaxID=270547 RepID=A0AAD3N9G1_LATJO|nr:potassium channel subfamily K member 4 [Lates japonicus]